MPSRSGYVASCDAAAVELGDAVEVTDRLPMLGELRRGDAGEFGAKAANLGELIHAGFRVPPGFALPAAMCGPGRPELTEVLAAALDHLGADRVAVRSSALGEDSARSSHAGVYDTFTDVAALGGSGVAAVATAVRACWASLDSSRAAAYRRASGLAGTSSMAVVVQQMIHADVSGVAFSVDPVSGDADTLLIESVSGAGSRLVSGTVRPERFRVARSRVVAHKDLAQGDGAVMLTEVATVLLEVEECLGGPVDVEWCWAGGTLHLVQARPTAGGSSAADRSGAWRPSDDDMVLRGEPACPGIATGSVRVVTDIATIDQVRDGEVLVTRFTSPEWMPALVRCDALVTEIGGVTSHAAIVSRELGLPCVVGAEGATKVLSTGDHVSVDGAAGIVHRRSRRRRG